MTIDLWGPVRELSSSGRYPIAGGAALELPGCALSTIAWNDSIAGVRADPQRNMAQLNASDSSTAMAGLKFKVAHKRAGSERWSACDRSQRKRLIQILRERMYEWE
jgi:hypothetical protein